MTLVRVNPRVCVDDARKPRRPEAGRIQRARGGDLLLLDVPLSVMCGACGDIQSVEQAPHDEREWAVVAHKFHCRCEVG